MSQQPRKNPPGQERALIGLAIVQSALQDLIDFLEDNPPAGEPDDELDLPAPCEAEGLYFMCDLVRSELDSTVLPFGELSKDVLATLESIGLPIKPSQAKYLRLNLLTRQELVAEVQQELAAEVQPAPSLRDHFRWQSEG